MNTTRTTRRLRGAALTLAATVLVAPLLVAPAATAAQALPEGLTQETAAASCWEIKQNTPAAPDGVYWLVTPSLVAPDQFYCDQTTDGGGWVLVGRGREGWKEGYNGLRTPAELRGTPTGTAAFAPAQLPAKTVDGLLNGGRVDALADGIRLRRATNSAGTAWQEGRFKLAKRDRWVWTFGAEHAVQTSTFDGVSSSGGQTANFGSNNTTRRVVFAEQSTHSFLNGFAFGSATTGSTAATTYVWSPSGQAYARPFTQMFLRPKLTIATLDFGSVPDGGSPAVTRSALPESNASATVWGVAGFANGNSGELNTEVATFGQVGNTVFVGGNFKTVQRSAAGADQVAQSYIAGFDVTTGQLVTSFRPTLNGQVKAVHGLPDGRLAIGGQFSTVNGTAQQAIAFLDPSTGQLSGTQVRAENRTVGGVPYVRDFDVQGGFLYVAGSFTHLTRVGSAVSASAWNGGRIALATTAPDIMWNAFLNGASVAVDASALGDRTYFAGYFKMKNTAQTPSGVAMQTVQGAPLVEPLWRPRFSKSGVDGSGNITGNVWQLGVTEAGGKVWLGGSEHSLFSYDRTTFALAGGSITKNGGDFQTVEQSGALVIGGCHCGNWVYQDAYDWSGVGTAWTQADKMNLVGAWDAATGRFQQEWSPTLQARAGYGGWGSFTDSTGVLWVGGDFSASVRAGGANQWSGGYIRFAPRDVTAPTTPGVPTRTLTNAGTQSQLSWAPATDAGGPVTYEILRENRVVASTTTPSYTVPVTDVATRWFIRARDGGGNRSASTPATVIVTAPDTSLTFVHNGANWSYRYSGDALPADWTSTAFDATSWAAGAAILGRGTAAAVTNVDPTSLATKPLSAQFRTSFDVTNASSVQNAKISVIANDGVVVWVNGVEVGRARMPQGAITGNTYSTGIVTHTAAAAARFTFDVPYGVLTDGRNTVAASVHANYRTTPDLSFDLTFTAERGVAPAPPDAVTALVGTPTDPTSAGLQWTAPVGGSPVASYEVSRDGVTIGSVPAGTTTFADTGLTPETAYLYTVRARGAGTLVSAPASVTVTTPATPPPPGDDELPVQIMNGATWSYRYGSDALPADWNALGFDASSWATGAGLFGVGVPGQATDLNALAVSPRPLSAQLRTTFAVTGASTVKDGTVTVIANDGVIVYLNGTELGRTRLPAGAIGQNTYASAIVTNAAAVANRSVFTVPASLLVEGENVIAASVHANYRATPDLSFDAALDMPR